MFFEHEWKINYFISNSWFLQSTELYSPFIMGQVVTNVFLMTFGIFEFNLVWKMDTYDYHCLIQSFKLFSTYILATTTYQLHRSVVCCNGHNDWHVRSVSAVLFWQICNRKLWANVRLYLLRYQLANGTIGIAEVRGVIDCQYTATYSIPWISYCFCEFGHICSRKSILSLNWWRQFSNY